MRLRQDWITGTRMMLRSSMFRFPPRPRKFMPHATKARICLNVALDKD